LTGTLHALAYSCHQPRRDPLGTANNGSRIRQEAVPRAQRPGERPPRVRTAKMSKGPLPRFPERAERIRGTRLTRRSRMLQELEAVQRGLNESAAKAAPKPKFAFKRSAAHPLPASDNATPPPPPPPPASTRPAAAHASGGGGGAPADALTLANQSRAHLSRADLPNRRTSLTDSKTPRDNSDSQCLALIALSECVVDLLEPTATEGEDGSGTRSALTSTTSSSSYAAIYLSDLRDSLVLLPENARQGSVLVQNCSRCVFVLGGHQVRLHFCPQAGGRPFSLSQALWGS
jgi:hypothetical protein